MCFTSCAGNSTLKEVARKGTFQIARFTKKILETLGVQSVRIDITLMNLIKHAIIMK